MHFELDGAGLIPSEEDSPHFPPQPTADFHPVNKNLFCAKGLSLTKGIALTTSRSDPHLNLTHLLHQENQVKEALNGLIVANEAQDEGALHYMNDHPLFHQLKGTTLQPSSCKERMFPHQLETGVNGTFPSSSALLDPSVNTGAPTLRKCSSALDWSFINEVGKESHIHHLADRPAAIFDPSRKKSYTHYGIPALALLSSSGGAPKEEQDGGLTMTIPSSTTTLSNTQSSSSSNTPSSGMFGTLSTTSGPSSSSSSHPLVAAASAVLHGGPSSSNPLQAGSAGLESAKLGEQQAAAAQADHKGLFGSVFNRGFLGRPVLRTDEENYRYIMALDR